MSDTTTLEVQPRDTIGKGVKKLRASDIIPAVVHNHGKESTHIQMDYQTFAKAYRLVGRHQPIELHIGSDKQIAMVRTVTYDPRLNNFTHVVFNAIKANQKVEAAVPVKPRYEGENESSPAERSSLIVLAQLTEVQVRALPRNLPEEIFYDAEKLVEIGDQLTVADLEVPEGVEIETDPEHVIATVFEPSALAAANEAAAGDAEEAAPAADETAGSAAAETPVESSSENKE